MQFPQTSSRSESADCAYVGATSHKIELIVIIQRKIVATLVVGFTARFIVTSRFSRWGNLGGESPLNCNDINKFLWVQTQKSCLQRLDSFSQDHYVRVIRIKRVLRRSFTRSNFRLNCESLIKIDSWWTFGLQQQFQWFSQASLSVCITSKICLYDFATFF